MIKTAREQQLDRNKKVEEDDFYHLNRRSNTLPGRQRGVTGERATQRRIEAECGRYTANNSRYQLW